MKISIITTVYKAEQDLPRLLESMMAQKAPELEFFLIDNGSPDRCGEICRAYAEKDPRFTVYTLEENIGYIRARNLGIEVCDGDYIGFCDSDDFLEPGGYDRAVEVIRDTGCDLYIGSYYQNGSSGQTRFDSPYPDGIYRSQAEMEQVLLQAYGDIGGKPILKGFVWKQIFKRSILMDHKIRFLENIVPYEDEIFNIDCLQHSSCVCSDSNPLYHYIVNEASITGKMTRNFSPRKDWERIEGLYREKDCRKETPLQHEAICNESLEMIYEYILLLCKQDIPIRKIMELFRANSNRELINKVLHGASRNQNAILFTVRTCLRLNAIGLLLTLVRLGLKYKYR